MGSLGGLGHVRFSHRIGSGIASSMVGLIADRCFGPLSLHIVLGLVWTLLGRVGVGCWVFESSPVQGGSHPHDESRFRNASGRYVTLY